MKSRCNECCGTSYLESLNATIPENGDFSQEAPNSSVTVNELKAGLKGPGGEWKWALEDLGFDGK
ncbi:MAG: hypothetical protein H6970_06785 [Gammaproteobacteria bacterium]|nr:hypothetical protein [Gammaproteobacteria bacterium]MCP5459205.1 hypothetical protein [Gammaproteobacteria bacterium]